MSFYLCIGRWCGLRFEIDYLTGIRIYLGWLSFGIVLYHLENMNSAAFSQLQMITQEYVLLANLVREKLPEDFNKLYPKEIFPKESEIN